MRGSSRQLHRRSNKSGQPPFKSRNGIPLARNDGAKMTSEEVAALLSGE
jgi:hypothetical protein